MKLQILQLDPTDDRISIQDKLSRVQADRVLLVWPRHGKPLTGRLELTLVQRKAMDLGLQLGVLSHDPPLLDAARRLEIPLFETIAQASDQPWPARPAPAYPRRPQVETSPEEVGDSPQSAPRATNMAKTWPDWLRYASFALALLSLIAAAAVILPAASLEIQPPLTARHQTVTVWVVPEDYSGDAPPNSIVGQTVQTTVTISDRTETSGSSQVADEAAVGTLTLTNLTDEEVAMPEGTSVRASSATGLRFVTTEPAQLPAGRGEQTTAAARAAQPGESSNVAAGLIDTVDGPLGLSVQVSNPDAFSGGADRTQSVVSTADENRLEALVEQAMLEQGQMQLEAPLPLDRKLLRSSIKFDQTLVSEFDAEPGDAAASLGLTMQSQISGLTYSLAEAEQAITNQLDVVDSEGWHFVPGSLDFMPQRAIEHDSRYGLRAATQWLMFQPIDSHAIRESIKGQPSDMLWEQLEHRFEIQFLSSSLMPSWWPYYPILANRIHLRYPWQAQ